MKRVLIGIVCLGLCWSLISLLNLSGRQADLTQDMKNLQRRYDALKVLYDQAKADRESGEADKKALEEAARELEEARLGQASADRDNRGLRQEIEALRRETERLALARDQEQLEWALRLQALTESKEAAEKRLSDALAVLVPAGAAAEAAD